MTKRASPTSIGVTARRVVAALSARGIDPAPLLRRAGLAPQDIADPDRRISARDENALIEMAAEAADDPAFGLRLTRESILREWGLIYYMASASSTLATAIELYAHYIPIANGGRAIAVALPADGPGSVAFQYVGAPRRAIRHTVEYHLSAFVQYLREIGGLGVNPASVAFQHASAGAGPAAEIERFFRCPVTYDADADRLVFDRGTLAAATLEANPSLLDLLRGYADRALTQLGREQDSVRTAVENELHRTLPNRGSTVDEVAHALNLATRSLVRRLADEGTSFSEVRDSLRRSLALNYLKDPQVSLCQAAWLLGYRDVGAFSSAFRRWFDTTPGAVRDDPERLEALQRHDGAERPAAHEPALDAGAG